MANSMVSALTENTAPLGSDLEYMVDDPNGTPADHKIYKGSNNINPDGHVINGSFSVTVSSNNITVALKTKSGGNPSATDPVSVWINGSYRRCTAALSVTKNAGTNWFNSGASILATKEIDYFIYLIWNTTPATDIMDIGFARIPNGRVYSDFSGTTTNEKYLAFANASTPTSTDDVVNVGRFAATLSASASYNWSVPTFTSANFIKSPCFETRVLSWTPAHSRVGGAYTNDPTVNNASYQVVNNRLVFHERHTQHATPGSSGNQTMTMPFTNGLAFVQTCYAVNNSTAISFSALETASSSTVNIVKYDGTAEATASNTYTVEGTFFI